MNMRGFGSGALALSLGLFGGCGGDDGGGGNATEAGTAGTAGTSAGPTSSAGDDVNDDVADDAPMTTAMDDDGPMTTGMDSTGMPPADSSGGGSSGEPPGTDSGGSESGGGAACEMCAMENCADELMACEEDKGCVAIRDCAQKNMCTGIACLGPCGDVITMNGGPTGTSAGLASALSDCVEAECADQC